MSQPEVEIIVASRAEAGEYLESEHAARLAYLVSIGDPEDELPAGYDKVTDKLRLAFYDTHDELGPAESDIERLIAFAHRIAGKRGTVLSHCHAGISRSSAAAYIIYAVVLGPGNEHEALGRVLRQREIAVPNRRMVRIADRLLGRDGALVAPLERI